MAVQKEVFTFFPPDWVITTTVATNIPCVTTKAGVAGKQHYLLHFSASVAAAATAATTVVVKDGATVIWSEQFGTSVFNVDRNFEKRPLPISNGGTLTVTLGAVGGTTAASVNMDGFTQTAP